MVIVKKYRFQNPTPNPSLTIYQNCARKLYRIVLQSIERHFLARLNRSFQRNFRTTKGNTYVLHTHNVCDHRIKSQFLLFIFLLLMFRFSLFLFSLFFHHFPHILGNFQSRNCSCVQVR